MKTSEFKLGNVVAVHSDYLNIRSKTSRRYHIVEIVWFVDNESKLCVRNKNIGYVWTLVGNLNKLYKRNKLNKKLYCDRIVEETEEWLIVK